MKSRLAFERHIPENIFDADYPLAILVKAKIARHTGARSVCANNVARRNAERILSRLETNDGAWLVALAPCVTHARQPARAIRHTLVQIAHVELPHTPYAKFVVRAFQHQATARWRIERDVAHSLSQTIFRQIEI